ncbi:uncharacterized protein PgNI_02577 [Pyricularia grisea]|uniref:Major facilitator superfamily (MFS) profile domain-containing protein n=1 Tax=Pyricularia grisea TaxID=148305 RepID=A0A6P8BNJ1_PYRGI|nr:uncharacterized protein PgNI_02577 [Pyricularia grisea]TLD17975.1 hypothetical protein PgNI_02577 [Pyricularia grisea]
MVLITAAVLTTVAFAGPAAGSYAFYVGRDLTADGSVMVGGTGEEVSSHWLQLFPARDHAANATITVGVTPKASIPGELFQIPQVNHTFRYLSMEYSDFEGFPAPLTNGGVNEYGVAVRDVWAQNRDELVEMTPTPQHGVQYSDLARIVLERAKTAREGVEMIGKLMDQYGEATYGGNTHLVADKDEGWVVWEMAGGKKLWAAERLKTDVVRVLYPGYIEDFPVDFANSSDYMGSANIVSFAVDQGWWDPKSGEAFNIFNAYGDRGDNKTARDGGFKFMSQAALENATLAMKPLTEEKLMERVRDVRISDDEAGYGQVVSLKAGVDRDMLRIWIAPTGSVAAPFVPWWLGVNNIPPEFAEHRYLTTGASSSFLNPDFELQEASEFAGRIFKRVMYYMCSAPETFHPVVTSMLTGFENQSRSDIDWVQKSAELLIKSGDRKTATQLLTYYSHSRAAKALELGKSMTAALDGYIKLTGQWKNPVGSEINDAGEGAETVNCLVGYAPDQPIWKQPANPRRKRNAERAMVYQRPEFMSTQALPLDDQGLIQSLPPTDEEANATETIPTVASTLQGHGDHMPDADSEDAPFLSPSNDPDVDAKGSWTPPPGFLWIEAAIMANVFLYGFDSTIMASTYAIISSEFDAANTASWLTTSYLVTSTAFQPLYGRFSDLFGRRPCFFVSSATFALGCLGCGLATDVVFLNIMRALTGFGGGGLVTLATIINSDMIPFQRRGMYQALQNGFVGFGAIAGASLGGAVADIIGWRWCFLSQVPISVAALVLGWFVVQNPKSSVSSERGVSPLRAIWSKVDISGALVLVVAISVQLVALSLGGNELPWSSLWVVGSLIGSSLLFALFFTIQHRTTAIPVIPLRLLHGFLPTVTQLANVSLGLSAYAYIFMLPLFCQVVLGDSATKAGARLVIPSLALPLGGLITGIVMSRWGSLVGLMRAGAIVMLIGNALTTSLKFVDDHWKYFVYIFPANLGQGIAMPAMLFTGLATFEHTDHAVSASVTYLIRSLGSVWGVALTSAILQTTLSTRLPDVLGDIENKDEIIEAIRHSITALKGLPDDVQTQARMVYYEGIHNAFAASTAFAGFAVVMTFLANPRGLRRSLN